MSENVFIAKLLAQGERITPVRRALIAVLSKTQEPQTQQELLRQLKKKGFKVNKTTVYRQLEALEKNGIIFAVHFTDRNKRYELMDENGHHHHLVCLKCGCIEDAILMSDLKQQEKTILKKHKFKVLRHTLEFFGICGRCGKKSG